jgi:inward rectifier potassium channel
MESADLTELPAMQESHAAAAAEAERPNFDPGLTQTYTGTLKRVINKDGQFNVRRTGRTWRDWHPYLILISVSWPRFIAMVTTGFLVVNTIFALLYNLAGIENLKNANAPTEFQRCLNAFFFSAHTLTTVGYGNMWPIGPLTNSIAVAESLSGVLGFAIATGLLFGRFSRPSARFGFSRNMIVAPYKGGASLQFRLVNRRTNNIVDLEARLLLMQVEPCGDKLERRFLQLDLERNSILFFPLTWTVVHPITPSSPLYGKSAADLAGVQAEVMILLKGFDDTFGQAVQTRYSYRYDEIVWGAKFTRAFEVEESGDMLIEVDKVSAIEPAELPGMAISD